MLKAYSPSKSHSGKRGRKKKNPTVTLDNEANESYKQWAIAVDKFFHCYPNKDELFKKSSKEEEQKAARKYRKDRQKFEEYLITHNIFLAINMASKYSKYYTDYDELLSAAMDGLVTAAQVFDPKRGNKFSTCAVHWIFRSIMKPFYGSKYNKHIKANTTIYLDANDFEENKDSDNFNYNTFSDKIDPVFRASCTDLRNPSDEIEFKANHYKVCKLLEQVTDTVNTSSLADIDKAVFEQMFLNEKPSKEIREDLGITQGELIKSKHRIMTLVSDKFKNYNSALKRI